MLEGINPLQLHSQGPEQHCARQYQEEKTIPNFSVKEEEAPLRAWSVQLTDVTHMANLLCEVLLSGGQQFLTRGCSLGTAPYRSYCSSKILFKIENPALGYSTKFICISGCNINVTVFLSIAIEFSIEIEVGHIPLPCGSHERNKYKYNPSYVTFFLYFPFSLGLVLFLPFFPV